MPDNDIRGQAPDYGVPFDRLRVNSFAQGRRGRLGLVKSIEYDDNGNMKIIEPSICGEVVWSGRC